MHGLGVFAVFSVLTAASALMSEPSHDPHVWSGAVMLYVLLALSAAATFISTVSFGIASAGLRRFSTARVAFVLGAAVGAIAALSVAAWFAVSPHTLSVGFPFFLCAALSSVSPLAVGPHKV